MKRFEKRLQQELHRADEDTLARIAAHCPADIPIRIQSRMLKKLGTQTAAHLETGIVQTAGSRYGWPAAAACAALCIGIMGLLGTLHADSPSMQQPDSMTAAIVSAGTETEGTERTTTSEAAASRTDIICMLPESASSASSEAATNCPVTEPATSLTETQPPQTALSVPVQESITSAGLGWQIRLHELDEEMILPTGETIPAGAVAATFSHPVHGDFDNLVLTLAIVQENMLYTAEDGRILLSAEAAMSHAMVTGQLSEDGRTLCIAGAAAVLCDGDAALFTLYLKPETQMTQALFEALSSEMSVTEAVPPVVNEIPEDTGNGWYVRWHYRAGDADDNTLHDMDEQIDTKDAVYILRACEAAPDHELHVTEIDDAAGTWRQYFPAARSAECADANGNTYITHEDASEILQYITARNTGRPYHGMVGTTLIDMAVIQ